MYMYLHVNAQEKLLLNQLQMAVRMPQKHSQRVITKIFCRGGGGRGDNVLINPLSADYDMQIVLCWIKEKCEAKASNTQTLKLCFFLLCIINLMFLYAGIFVLFVLLIIII